MTAAISANDVKVLREKTGAGMMDCKKALVEAEGNMEKAEELIAKAGLRKAQKSASRTAAEGVVMAVVASDNKSGALIEINCETDFVARDEGFKAFCDEVAQLIHKNQTEDLQKIFDIKMASGLSIEDARQALVAKIGENIQIRRVKCMKADDGVVAAYSHDGRLATLVKLSGAQADLARDIAMHATAMNPKFIRPEEVPQAVIDKEKDIFVTIASESGKPANIIEKMVEGQINKYLAEICLMGQSFIKDPDKKISQLLKEKNADVQELTRFGVGEGIEVEKKSFHEEVMMQASRS